MRDLTLARTAIGSDTLAWRAAQVLGGSLFVAVAAQVSIPLLPVPLTLQTLAVLLVGLTLGSRLGALALATYVAEGAMGLPVFANGGAGVAALVGPTGGFIFGFILMAWVAGLAADMGQRRIVPVAGFALLASVVLYIPGVLWPMSVASAFGIDAAWAGTSAAKLWAGWVQPFVIGDALKALVAALIVTGAWDALAKRRR